jgi:catechol 2,3-dioxygenase-like lactoylglutathione lyase family enzyme
MSVQLNHTIVCARDKRASAAFMSEVLDVPVGPDEGPFVPLELENAVTLDFMDRHDDFTLQHYAFLVDGETFELAYKRMQERDITIFADPFLEEPGETYLENGMRGFYFRDLNGHTMELLTRV